MTAAFEELLVRARSWSPKLQAEAEQLLRDLESLHEDDLGEIDEAFLESDEMSARLKRAYDEGIESGPGVEIDADTFLDTVKERAASRG